MYLNDQENQKIPGGRKNNWIIIKQLKPNTEYIVGIETQDGSLQRSRRVIKKFKTMEEGKSEIF